MSTRLAGKIALVTGGASGIGKATSLLFAREGATVIVSDIDAAAATRTMAELAGPGVAIATDVSKVAEVESLFAEIETRFGRLDVLVTSAGIAESSPERMEAFNRMAEAKAAEGANIDITREMPDADWHRVIDVNLHGTFYCVRAALRPMSRQNGGSIVCISSIAGLMSGFAGAHYSASKAGVLGLVKSVGIECGSRNIRINAICPGAIDTPLAAPISPLIKQMMVMQTPLHRIGRAEEVAYTALFLALDESSFYTAQWLSPNGGFFTG
jgi:3-oxoacyl-[acyl-carrier protein] reductase